MLTAVAKVAQSVAVLMTYGSVAVPLPVMVAQAPVTEPTRATSSVIATRVSLFLVVKRFIRLMIYVLI